MAAPYKRTQLQSETRVADKISKDSQYWNNFQFPVTVKEFGAVTSLDFSPTTPHFLASTSSVRVQIYHPVSHRCEQTISRFKSTAHGGVFRGDGQLLAAGNDDGEVKLFRVGTKSQLRVFKGHKQPVKRVRFLADHSKLASFGDDCAVKVWDIPTETATVTFTGDHSDYVRAGNVSHGDVIVSGGYDRQLHMYDVRVGKKILSLDHGSPVEDVLLFPSGGVLVSAGGSVVKVWDVLGRCRLRATLTNHHKTVTSVCFASNYQRLFSASLDRHVKIYDVSCYQVVHTLNFPSSLLSVGVSRDDNVLAAGSVDGHLSILNRKKEDVKLSRRERRVNSTNRIYLRGEHYTASKDDILVKNKVMERLAVHDEHLKRFNITRALDSVIMTKEARREPKFAVSVIQELIRRGALRKALAGRSPNSVKVVMDFVVRNIGIVSFMPVLTIVADTALELYGELSEQNNTIQQCFSRLQAKLTAEVNHMSSLERVAGALDTILASSLHPPTQRTHESLHSLDGESLNKS